MRRGEVLFLQGQKRTGLVGGGNLAAQELGQGGDIGSLMLTLEALKPLGIKPEQVRLVQNDTKLCPDSGMSGASRTHFMSGNATIDAANKLLAAMRKAK